MPWPYVTNQSVLSLTNQCQTFFFGHSRLLIFVLSSFIWYRCCSLHVHILQAVCFIIPLSLRQVFAPLLTHMTYGNYLDKGKCERKRWNTSGQAEEKRSYKEGEN